MENTDEINPVRMNIEWEKENSDLSKCCHCGETIYGSMYRMVVSFGLRKFGKKATDTINCESCHDFVLEEEIKKL